MELYHFTEFAWPHLPPDDEFTSMRVNLPSRVYDPIIGAELYNAYLDQYVLADELGLNCMINEHHQTATCLNASGPLQLAILARQTKNARLLILGNPVANLADPIRCAEEMAMIDNISHGRLECGFVRGVPYELFSSNRNPTETAERLWDSIDLIIKAWTSHDGPFNYEGKWIHKRQVNVWPRPYQQPHPRIWTTGGSDLGHACKTVERGFTFSMFLTPVDKLAKMFNGVRDYCRDQGLPAPADDQFAFMPLVAVGETEEWFTGYQSIRMTPRDFAKSAQVIVDDGMWQGERFLPEAFVHSLLEAPDSGANPSFGLFHHLNAGSFHRGYVVPDRIDRKLVPGAPDDLFLQYGAGGQIVAGIPSLRLVIVRTGRDNGNSIYDEDNDIAQLLKRIADAAA